VRALLRIPTLVVLLLAAACTAPSGPTAAPSLPSPSLIASLATASPMPAPSPSAPPTVTPSPSPAATEVATPSLTPTDAPTAAPTPAPTPTTAPGTPSPASRIAGDWTGKWKDTKHPAFHGTFHVALERSGKKVSGTISLTNSCLDHGEVSGTVTSEGAISFGAGAATGSTTISFTGQLKGDKLSGEWIAPSQACNHGSGTWTATRD
jgi:hypothetical protein